MSFAFEIGEGAYLSSDYLVSEILVILADIPAGKPRLSFRLTTPAPLTPRS
jgi:hypothetical protein